MKFFDKFLMQGLSKYYKENYHDLKIFVRRLFQKYFRNIPQKQLQKLSKSKRVWFMLSYLQPHVESCKNWVKWV
jgi:hypothetical protein